MGERRETANDMSEGAVGMFREARKESMLGYVTGFMTMKPVSTGVCVGEMGASVTSLD